MLDFFRDNLLVGEYLGGEEDNPLILAEDNEDSDRSGVDYVPYSMDSGMGIRTSITICSPASVDEVTDTHQFIPFDYVIRGNENFYVMEAEALELQKALGQLGATTKIAKNTRIVQFYDHYVNFPLISHSGDDIASSVHKTVASLKLILMEWKKREVEKVVAYNLGFRVEDREVRISVMGHINDVLDWLDNPMSQIPLSKEAIEAWAEQVSDFLDTRYPKAEEKPILRATLMRVRFLSIQRRRLSDNQYEFAVDDEIGPLIKVILPPNLSQIF